MKRSFLVAFSKFFPILAVIAFWGLLVSANYTPGTFLSGWDNLHPEFNFGLNIKRSLSAVWREHQGLGLLGGMAHAADLPRELILWFFSLALPLNLLRYFWVFAMLVLGPIGTYFFVRLLTGRKALPPVAASLFYLLNLATVQYFYTPFETFVSFYGFLPWLLYLGLRYVKEGGRRKLLPFLAISFLATPAFYVQTLFIVYALFLGILGLETAIKQRLPGLKRFLFIVLAVLIANSYWLLPASYFTLTNSKVFSLSHQNSITSEDTRYFNRNRGIFDDVVKLKGFWFDYRDLNDGIFEEVLEGWENHVLSKNFNIATYVLFFTSALGLLFGVFSKKVGARFAGISLFGVCYLMLTLENLPLGPILSEAFRSVFTKFSVAFSLIVALGIGYFTLFVSKVKNSGKYLAAISVIGLGSLMVFTVKPAFEGKLFYENLKVNIPAEYFAVFEYFKEKPKEARIATLPLNTFWGWDFHSWGERGSGLLWYGIEQPVLHRSFDVWSSYNETFYNEAAFALYTNNQEVLEKVLEKYQVKYLLLDESIINAGGSPEILFVDEIKSLIAASESIREAARFGPPASGLTVYEVSSELTGSNLVSKSVFAPESFGRFDTDSTYSSVDTVFTSYGNYVNDSEGTTFPFVNFDKRVGVTVEDIGERTLIKSRELQFQGTKDLVYPDLVWGEKEESPRVVINEEKKVQVSLPIDQKISADLAGQEQEGKFQNCDLKKVGTVERRSLDNGERSRTIEHKATNGGVACEFFNFPDLSHSAGYALHIKGENRAGRGLKIYLQNWKTGRMDLEELLPEGSFDEYYFILPKGNTEYRVQSTEKIQSGYSLNLETRSFGRIASENTIEAIEFVPVPIEWLRQIRLEPAVQALVQGLALQGNNLKVKDVKKTGTWLYRVEVERRPSFAEATEGQGGLLELGQGYEPGWIAFTQIRQLPHVRVNSWANGWFIPSNQLTNNQITIIFWPQLLEYLGFGVLGLTGALFAFKMIKLK